jgi:uncharacterized membrane protein YeaQ/YmgE (transglycosylase-associated protein family)
MDLFAWIVVGFIAGFLAKAVMKAGDGIAEGWLATMFLGILGAVVGGWIWNFVFHSRGATGINLISIFVAFVGSCVVISLIRFIRARS